MAKSKDLIKMQESFHKTNEAKTKRVVAALGNYEIVEPGDADWNINDVLKEQPDFEKENGFKPTKLYWIVPKGKEDAIGDLYEDKNGEFHAMYHEGHGFMTEIHPTNISQALSLINWNSAKFK